MMTKNRSRSVTLAGLSLGAVAIGAFAVVPALGQGAVRVVNSLVTCASASACVDARNTSTGQGVKGASAKGPGVEGQTTFGSAGSQYESGVIGRDLSSTGTGDIGVFGVSTRGVGARGVSASGAGVLGQSTSANGVVATSVSNDGILGVTSFGGGGNTNHSGVAGFDNSTLAVGGGDNNGVFGGSHNWTGVRGDGYTGVEAHGREFGVFAIGGYALSGLSDSYPLFLTNAAGNQNLFYVDGSGNVYYHGTLNNFAATRNKSVATTYVANTTTPTVEDSGTARLINGQATVRLESAFAQTIDASQPYQVMLTPGGDTRGLFVATKTPGVFVVRELQGGRSTLAFDYHIYAHAFGHGNERIMIRSASAAASLMPKMKQSSMSLHTMKRLVLPYK